MKNVPNSSAPKFPNGMFARRISRSTPFSSTIVLSATCELEGLTRRRVRCRRVGTTDRTFLLFDRQRIPRLEIVQVLLHDHITAVGEVRVAVTDQNCGNGVVVLGVLGAVDEPQEVAAVEVAEAVGFVDDLRDTTQAIVDLRHEFEAQVHRRRPHVEQEVARGGGRVVCVAVQRYEFVEFGGARPGEQSVPQRRSDPHDDREPTLGDAESDGTTQACEVAEQIPDRGFTSVVHRHDKEDRRLCQGRHYRLRASHKITVMDRDTEWVLDHP